MCSQVVAGEKHPHLENSGIRIIPSMGGLCLEVGAH